MQAQSTHSVPKLPLELAAAKLYKMGIKSWRDFRALSSGEMEGVSRPADIPSHPTEYYDGLNSFEEFIERGRKHLNTHADQAESSNVMSLERLKHVVNTLQIDSQRKWMKAVRDGNIPGYYPTRPDRYYADWSGWKDFLAPKKRFLDFDDARKEAIMLAREYGLESQKDWRNLSRARKRPGRLPSNPNEYYADQWVSWAHWFGLEA